MSTTTIPTQIIDFNIYNAPNKLIGAGDEVTLPKIVSKTYTAALAGGDIDLPGLTTKIWKWKYRLMYLTKRQQAQ